MKRKLQHKEAEVRFGLGEFGRAVVSIQMEDGGSFDIAVSVNRFDREKRHSLGVSVDWTTTEQKRRGRDINPLLYMTDATEQTVTVLQSSQIVIDERPNGLGTGSIRLPASGWKTFGEIGEAFQK